MKGLVIIVICLATLLLLFPYDQISDEEQQFIDFIRIYKRSYQSEEEYKHRLQVFIKNLIKMEELRIRNPRARFAVNDFADRTEDEMKQNFGFVKNTQRRYNKQTEVSGTNVDWSSLWTTVKNQGNCGSCWAFSAIASFEGRYTISVGKKTVQDFFLKIISPLNIFNVNIIH